MARFFLLYNMPMISEKNKYSNFAAFICLAYCLFFAACSKDNGSDKGQSYIPAPSNTVTNSETNSQAVSPNTVNAQATSPVVERSEQGTQNTNTAPADSANLESHTANTIKTNASIAKNIATAAQDIATTYQNNTNTTAQQYTSQKNSHSNENTIAAAEIANKAALNNVTSAQLQTNTGGNAQTAQNYANSAGNGDIAANQITTNSQPVSEIKTQTEQNNLSKNTNSTENIEVEQQLIPPAENTINQNTAANQANVQNISENNAAVQNTNIATNTQTYAALNSAQNSQPAAPVAQPASVFGPCDRLNEFLAVCAPFRCSIASNFLGQQLDDIYEIKGIRSGKCRYITGLHMEIKGKVTESASLICNFNEEQLKEAAAYLKDTNNLKSSIITGIKDNSTDASSNPFLKYFAANICVKACKKNQTEITRIELDEQNHFVEKKVRCPSED